MYRLSKKAGRCCLRGVDRYDTPEWMAERLLHMADAWTVNSVVDPSAGAGALARCASARFRASAIGCVDIDESVVRALRAEHPDWIVDRGDATSSTSLRQTAVFAALGSDGVDLLVMNPPFSERGRRKHHVEFKGRALSCSTAMLHVLVAIDTLCPKRGLLAILPESAAHSELDSDARASLAELGAVTIQPVAGNSAFGGVRAAVCFLSVDLHPMPGHSAVAHEQARADRRGYVSLIRGTLPMFQALPATAESVNHGRVLHSTSLSATRWDAWRADALVPIAPLSSGTVRGQALLLPRVGLPRSERIFVRQIDERVRLSDCVIAVQAESSKTLERLHEQIQRDFSDFTQLYCGTGARYVTVRRLSDFLDARGFSVRVERGSVVDLNSASGFDPARLRTG